MCEKLLEKFPWITNEFFKRKLIDAEKEKTDLVTYDLLIDGFELRPAVGKGENFTSDLIRAKVTYRKNEKSEVKYV